MRATRYVTDSRTCDNTIEQRFHIETQAPITNAPRYATTEGGNDGDKM